MANKTTSLDTVPKRVILEYTANDLRIYGFGIMKSDGEIELDGKETFGSFPNSPSDVLKADGTLVSDAAHCTEIGLSG